MSNGTKQEISEMKELINALNRGDRIRVVFTDTPIVDQAAFIMTRAIFTPNQGCLDVGEAGYMNLSAVAATGHWAGCCTYEATVGEDPDLRNIADRLPPWLDSIELITP